MTEVLHCPFFSLRGEKGIVARKGSATFSRVIHEPTTFSLDVKNGNRAGLLGVTIYPSTPENASHMVFQTGGALVIWKRGVIFATGDDPLDAHEQYRRHELTGERGLLTLAPVWSGPDDISEGSLHVAWGVPVTVVKSRSCKMHLPVALPQIVYSFLSPPRE